MLSLARGWKIKDLVSGPLETGPFLFNSSYRFPWDCFNAVSHCHLLSDAEGCMGQGQNLRGRNLKLMIRECIGHCRREGENRTAKIQSREDCRILSNGWRERREEVRTNRQQ